MVMVYLCREGERGLGQDVVQELCQEEKGDGRAKSEKSDRRAVEQEGVGARRKAVLL